MWDIAVVGIICARAGYMARALVLRDSQVS
jgi:hypothetical protein